MEFVSSNIAPILEMAPLLGFNNSSRNLGVCHMFGKEIFLLRQQYEKTGRILEDLARRS